MEGGGSSSNSCMMGFPGGNSNGLICPMIMMPPPLISSHSNSNAEINSNNHHDQNSHFTSLSPPPPLVLEYHHNIQSKNTSTEGYYFMENIDDHNNNNNNNNGYESSACNSSLRDKIIAHPHYRRLLTSYLNCQKIGAPAEVVARLEESCTAVLGAARAGIGCIGEDPTLDQFMEAYSEMLTKYELELSKPFSEAMLFLSRIECQFKALTVDSSQSGCLARNGSEDANRSFVDPHAEDKELKGQLLRKYSGYLGSLKQEFMKKRKRGKLPKEARQQLLEWWNRHYKWPYPSETQKLALAESTGLDQKQINNWFINQRKRHWKPSEDMQLIVMDAAAYPAHCYLQDNVLANPFPVDISSAFL